HRPVSRDRAALGPVLRAPPEWWTHAGRHLRRARQPEAHLLAGPLPRHGDRDDLAEGGAEPEPAHRREPLHRCPVACGWRPLRFLGYDTRLGQGRAAARRERGALHAGAIADAATGWLLAGSHR